MKFKYIGFIACFSALIACDDVEMDTDASMQPMVYPALDKNGVDFSNYVALGASFTAGYTDGALFKIGQTNSFPNMLAKKFSGEDNGFTQPMMSDNTGGFLFRGAANESFPPRLYFNGAGPVRLTGTPTTDALIPTTGPFQNMGVPGAKSIHLLFNGLGDAANLATSTANPYFVRMASAPDATMLGDAIGQNPTFFSLSEIGGNDVLGYATTGGDGSNPITPNEGEPGVGFSETFTYIVETMSSGGAKGVVTNVPYVSSLPHFTTVPHNPVPLDAATAAAVNKGYAAYNVGIEQALAALKDSNLFTEEEAAKRTITFAEGETNAVVIIDENLTDLGAINSEFEALPKYRQATAEDLLLLPTSSLIGEVDMENVATLMGDGVSQEDAGAASVIGVTLPLEDKWVLLPEEQADLNEATDTYNTTIANVATEKGLALVDLNGILNEAATTGIVFGDFTMTTDLVFGGLVSLDGIHLTARGYALMANKFLEAIDDTYGTNFEASNNLNNPYDYLTNYSPLLE